MVVSHYVVSAVTIAGLVAGALGVFCLSQGLIGPNAGLILRAVLMGLAFAIFAGLVTGYYDSATASSWHINPTFQSLNPFGDYAGAPGSTKFIVIGAVSGAVLGFIFGFSASMIAQKLVGEISSDRVAIEGFKELATEMRGFPAIILLGVIVTILFSILLSTFGLSYLTGTPVLAAFVDTIVVFVGLGLLISLAPLFARGSQRQLQLIGLGLTLLGIATQFIPPTLDLLNIPIR